METAAQGLLTRDEMESRRLMAAQDLQRGLSQSQVSRKFGVSRTTASRWHRALSGRGVESLRKRRAPGRPCRLTAQQLADVAALYRMGPQVGGVRCRPLDHHALRRGDLCPVRRAVRSRPRRPDHAPARSAGAPARASRFRKLSTHRSIGSRLPGWRRADGAGRPKWSGLMPKASLTAWLAVRAWCLSRTAAPSGRDWPRATPRLR